MRIVCIGDSLVRGLDWGYNSDLQKPLNVRLSEKYGGIAVVNLGINGDGTLNVYNRRESVVEYDPFRVIVWAGVNDTATLTAQQIETNLQNTYNYFAALNYEVIAVTITPVDTDPQAQNSVRWSVNDWMKNTAANVVKVADAFTAIADPLDVTQRLEEYADINTPVHLNDAGMAAVANLI